MLSVQHLSKSYGIAPILDDVTFVINRTDRVGLVGANGSGKTSLLRIIAGEDTPDGGHVAIDKSAMIGYLRQGVEPPPGQTLGDAIRAGVREWDAARADVENLAESLREGGDLDQYGNAVARFEALGGYGIEHRIEEMLAHLGLGHLDSEAKLATLSGGEQTRAGLAAILLAEPDILLLDEPTNHLDIAALEWLEGFITSYPGAVLIVSHDRVFLDHTVTRILELDDKTRRITEHTGNYSEYAEQKAHSIANQWEAWKDQQAEIRRIRHDIQETIEHSRWVERTTTPRQPGVRRIAKKVAKKAKSREKKLKRYLESGDRVEKPDRSWEMKLDFGEMPRSGQDVLELKDVGQSFNGRGWLFRDLAALIRHGERIALVGPNGSGKSTLLRILAGDLAPQEGMVRLGANVRIGYMPQKQETLDPASTPLKMILDTRAMSETDARNFLHYFLFAGDEVFTPIRDLSYGERSRLLLAKSVAGGANCLILDEPVNHLDIPSRQRFEQALSAFPGAIIAAAHDRAFIAGFASVVWKFEEGQLRMEIQAAESYN